MTGVPRPSDARRCQAITRAGKRCSKYATGPDENGRPSCSSHGGPGASLINRDPAKAQAASIESRRRKKADREHQEYLRSLGLREQVRARIEDRSTQIVDRLMELAMDPDPQVSLRAIDALWNRSYGRPMQPTVQANLTPSGDRSAFEEMRAQLMALDPEARRRIARQQMGLPPLPDIEQETR